LRAVLADEEAVGEAACRGDVGDVDAVRLDDVQARGVAGVDRQDEGVGRLALVDLEGAGALAEGDEIPLGPRGVVDGQPFDVGLEAVLAHAGDEGAPRSGIGLGAELPHADGLLRDVERPEVEIGDAPLGGRADPEGADQTAADRAPLCGFQPELLDASLLARDEDVAGAVAPAAVDDLLTDRPPFDGGTGSR